MAIIEILCIATSIFLLLYYYCTKSYHFWKVRGVKGPKPLILVGNQKEVMMDRITLAEHLQNICDEFKGEKMVGIFVATTPTLVLKDPDLIKDVLIKDFNQFRSRGLLVLEEDEPMTTNLFMLEYKRWRPLRNKLSPAFTSSKLKEMFHLIIESSENLGRYLETIVVKNEPIECRHLSAKFTVDVIGSCAFGLNMNAINNDGNEFFAMGKQIFEPNFWGSLFRKIREITPRLYCLLIPLLANKKSFLKFTNLIKDTMEYRKKNNIIRHDFIDLLRSIKENPDIVDHIEMTDSLAAAQAFTFFLASFDTTSSTISHALYELALNISVQEKLRNEILEELKKTSGKINYDSVKNMKYLEKVFQETLRKYPVGTTLLREASEQYTFSGTNVTIPKGLKIFIPVYAIHRDPDNFANPEVFDPERFEEEAIKARHPMLYLPFGDGPRFCIGARFANFQVKVGIITILQKYTVDVCDKTPIPYISNPRAVGIMPKGGKLHLKFSKVC